MNSVYISTTTHTALVLHFQVTSDKIKVSEFSSKENSTNK